MSPKDDQDGEKSKVVPWDENRSLCEAYRNRPSQYGNLSEEYRNTLEQKEDAAAARRLARKLLSFRRKGHRAKEKNAVEPVIKRLAYRPKNNRLKLVEDLSLQQIDIDADWELQHRSRGSISVYCDLGCRSNDLFLTDAFHYRHGRPYDLKIDCYKQSHVKNAIQDLTELPFDYRDLIHTQAATCVCKCSDCRKNPNCECALLAKLLNKGLVCLKNNKFYIDEEVPEINHEEMASLGMGCGQACSCYQHRKCEKNVDLLHLNMPKLEIFRRDRIMNFGVRTLESLQPGDVVCEFTGKLETVDMVKECNGADAYSFQIVFDENLDHLTATFINEIEKNAEYRQFANIYNNLREHANDLEEKTITANISPLATGNVAQFFAHGCLPNVEVIRVMANHALPQFHRLFLIAARHIEAGEELFISYGEGYVRQKIKKCLCASPLCFHGPYKSFLNSVSCQKLEQYLSSIFLPNCRNQAENTDRYLQKLIEGGILSRSPKTSNTNVDFIEYEDDEEIAKDQKKYYDYIIKLKQGREEDMIEDFKTYEKIKPHVSSSRNETMDYFSVVKVKREPSDIIEVFQRPITLDDTLVSCDPPTILPTIKIEPLDQELIEQEVQTSVDFLTPTRKTRSMTKSKETRQFGTVLVPEIETKTQLSPKKPVPRRRTVVRKRSARKSVVISSSSSSERSPERISSEKSTEQDKDAEKESKQKALEHQKEIFAKLGLQPISHEVKSLKIPMKKRQEPQEDMDPSPFVDQTAYESHSKEDRLSCSRPSIESIHTPTLDIVRLEKLANKISPTEKRKNRKDRRQYFNRGNFPRPYETKPGTLRPDWEYRPHPFSRRNGGEERDQYRMVPEEVNQYDFLPEPEVSRQYRVVPEPIHQYRAAPNLLQPPQVASKPRPQAKPRAQGNFTNMDAVNKWKPFIHSSPLDKPYIPGCPPKLPSLEPTEVPTIDIPRLQMLANRISDFPDKISD